MTTSAVSQINLFTGSAQKSSSVKTEQTDSFSQIFASQTETRSEAKAEMQETKTDHVQKEESVNKEVAETQKETEAVTDAADTEDVSNEEVQEIDQEKTDEVFSQEQLEAAVTELLTTIQEVMNVSPEDIQKTLDQLGMEAEDLLNTKNIPSFVVALTEGADELSLMTNETAFANLQEITAKAEGLLAELSEQTGMSFDEIQTAISKMTDAVMQVEEPVVHTNVEPSDVMTDQERGMQLGNDPLKAMQSVSTERTGDQNRDMAQDNTQSHTNEQQMTFSHTVVDQLEQAVSKTESVMNSYSTTTESVMNQIQDAIRVIQTQDMTEMDLQLHPASLGNLRIQIAAKEGVVTATFTTENEAVKAALESQMITLKENFAQQGIKVEAVEVTVASHAFEQNLQSDENNAGEQAEPEKRRSRKISLSELTMDGLEEELSDEERIVAEMMRENGNTVDYTV